MNAFYYAHSNTLVCQRNLASKFQLAVKLPAFFHDSDLNEKSIW